MSTTTARSRTIADGVRQLPTDYPTAMDAPLWVYALRSRGVTLIDSGIPSTWDAVLGGALAAEGIGAADVRDIALTHGHPDHQGGARTIQGITGATIAAPLDDALWVEDPERQWRELWDGYPGVIDMNPAREVLVGMCSGAVRVDRLLRDGDLLALEDRELRVIQTRGHSRGHVAYLDTSTGCLFTGDVVQARGLRTSSGSQVLSPMYQDVGDYRAGLRRLLATPFEHLCPAHLEVTDAAGGRALIEASLGFVDEVDQLVRDAVVHAPAPVPAREVAARIGRLVGCETVVNMQTTTVAVAHLTELAREGLVEMSYGPAQTAQDG
jgi:glyoxylase-like metal-dependent hydrolase (beta-lactamase superfamily II)